MSINVSILAAVATLVGAIGAGTATRPNPENPL